MARSNNLLVPQAREAMNQFKYETAQELGVNLKQGYNGDLTSREAGSIGGQMVKKMIYSYQQQQSGATGGMMQDLSQAKALNQQSRQGLS